MADDELAPSENLADILKSAHDEVPEVEDLPIRGKKKKLGKYTSYKNFGLEQSQERKEYDTAWVYTNIGADTPEDYEGQPTKSGEKFLRLLQSNEESMLKFMENCSSLTAKSMDKRNAASSEVEKKFDDNDSIQIDFLVKYEATLVKQGMRPKVK